MRILHVWDMAGVSHIIAKYQRLRDHTVTVLTRPSFDIYGIGAHYNTTHIHDRVLRYVYAVMRAVRHADIIHVHDSHSLMRYIRLVARHKPIVYHHHGSYARNTPADIRHSVESKANIILVSTPDLLDYTYMNPPPPPPIWLPNPVDTDMFTYQGGRVAGTGLYHLKKSSDSDKTVEYLVEQYSDTQWTGHDRRIHNTPYEQMPSLLSKYEYYSDIIWYLNQPVPTSRIITMTGLQALAVGCKVITSDGVLEGVPTQHEPERVVDKLQTIYDSLLTSP